MNWNDIFECRDGKLFWNEKRKGRKMGVAVGALRNDGYIQVGYNRKLYLAHRIVWEKHNGPIPEGAEIDHINHIKHDNRIENLRLVSRLENLRNQSMRKGNTSGYVGVYWHRQGQKWVAKIMVKGKTIHLGLFNDIEAAVEARKLANEKYKFHENHGV